jgi:hypothetical protein
VAFGGSADMTIDDEGEFARRERIFRGIRQGNISLSILQDLIPDGRPHEYEYDLWDYKIEFPDMSGVGIHKLIKHIVAFHNSYGGYIVFGVKDKPREIVGFAGEPNLDQLKERIKGATGAIIDIIFGKVQYSVYPPLLLGLLLIPARSRDAQPVAFRKPATQTDEGEKAYSPGDVFLRDDHSSRRAKSVEDWAFLFSPRSRQIAKVDLSNSVIIDNNIPIRDPELVRFVGRDAELTTLWKWLSDRFNPVKIIAGMGGVGKTTLARQFCEQLIDNDISIFERIIWLTAKQIIFVPRENRADKLFKIGFTDERSLLLAILYELGKLPADYDDQTPPEVLLDDCVEAANLTPSLVIVDDLDSLDLTQQQEVFHKLLAVCRGLGSSSKTRFLVTTRLNLGAGSSQLIPLGGLTYDDFIEYVEIMSKTLGVPIGASSTSGIMKKFHRVTSGSPIFVLSVLRLVNVGWRLDKALSHWEGEDGDEARRFAFERELEQLSESELRTLYAIIQLGETSPVELLQLAYGSRKRLEDDINKLRNYHLLALESDIPAGGARLSVPAGIRMMASIVAEKLPDPRRIERDTEGLRRKLPEASAAVGEFIHRIVAFWKLDDPTSALSVAEYAVKKLPEEPDLRCMLGRALLRVSPSRAREADLAFRDAEARGCTRSEHLTLWIEARMLMEDWHGVIELAKLSDKRFVVRADAAYYRAIAAFELAKQLDAHAEYHRATSLLLETGQYVQHLFLQRAATGRVQELREIKEAMIVYYISIIDRNHQNPHEMLETWIAVMTAFECFVRPPRVIHLGLQRLRSWWLAVEQRPIFDARALGHLDRSIAEISRMQDVLSANYIKCGDSLAMLSKERDYLIQRREDYMHQRNV